MVHGSKPNTAALPSDLISEIASESARIVLPEYKALVTEIKSLYGSAVDGIILYGSCLRSSDLDNKVADLYVLVDDYRNVYTNNFLSLLNTFLPPNVFYLEVCCEDKIIRTKYSVITTEDFIKGVESWYHSYLWARFAQPVRILYTRDDDGKKKLHTILAYAVLKFLKTTIPLLGKCNADTEKIWINSLSYAYAAELRPERENRAKQLTYLNMGDYIRLTTYAAPALEELIRPEPRGYYQCLADKAHQRRARRNWRIRRWQGRILSVCRLIKATFTFNDCIDYAAWKIQRHTGVAIEVTPEMQRHPVIKGSAMLWQLVRRGIMR